MPRICRLHFSMRCWPVTRAPPRTAEIDREIIEAVRAWTRDLIETVRVPKAPSLLRLVIGVDPPGSARPGSDACGIV